MVSFSLDQAELSVDDQNVDMDRLPPELLLAVFAHLLPALFSSSSSSNGRDDDWIAPPPPPLSELAELRRVSRVCGAWEGLLKGVRARDVVVEEGREGSEDPTRAKTVTVLRRADDPLDTVDGLRALLGSCAALRALSVVGGGRLDGAFFVSSPSTLRTLTLHDLALSTALPSLPNLTSLYLDAVTISFPLNSSFPSLRLLSLHIVTLAPQHPAPLAAFPSLIALSSDPSSLRPLLSASSPPTLPCFPPHFLLTLSLADFVHPSSLFPSAGPSTLSPFFPDPPTHLSISLVALLSRLCRGSRVSLCFLGRDWAKEPSAFAAARVGAVLRELGENRVASVYIPAGHGMQEVYRAILEKWEERTGGRVELDGEEKGERLPQSWPDEVWRACRSRDTLRGCH